MKAVVMAGGEGSRLRPLTVGRPKPMVPLVNKPVLGHILDLLKHHDITDVVITLQFMPTAIQDFYGDGSHMGMNIKYVVEETPLGTAGGVANAARHLDETFLVISGDALTDFDLNAILADHRRSQSMATLTLYRVSDPSEYGVINTDDEGWITQFLEKPDWGTVISDTVNTGIYVLEPEILDLIPEQGAYDFSKQLFPRLLEQGTKLNGYVAEGYWCDVGNMTEYMRANADLLSGRVQISEPLGEQRWGDLIVGSDVEIAPDAQIFGPVYLGHSVKIKAGVSINGPAVIRDYTVIDNHSRIERCVMWRNTYVGEACELRGVIVCRQCSIKSGAVAYEGVVIGDNCILDENSVLYPDVKLWPNKKVEPGTSVRRSIIWGNQSRRSLFGKFGVTGIVNVDLTPEFAAKLGSALGAALPKGSYVAINRDGHRSSRMLKRALISGLPSAGVHVRDLNSVPIPVARHMVRSSEVVSAGIHVRLSPFDQRVVDIRFMSSDGMNQSRDNERNVERIFFREDFRRAFLDEIGRIEYATDSAASYSSHFLQSVDRQCIRSAQFRLLVDYSHGQAGDTLSSLLNRLNVEYLPLNALTDESKLAVLRDKFQGHLHQMAKIMSVLDVQLGIKLDVGGEKIFIVDEQGQILDNLTAALLVTELAFFANPNRTLVLPITLPRAFETVAHWHGGRVVHTKSDLRDLMRAANQRDVLLALDGTGHFLFPDFLPAADGLMGTVRLIEYLIVRGMRVSEVVSYLPRPYMAQDRVNCSWDAKATVMRVLNQRYQGSDVVNLDGIKIHFGTEEWVHIGPNPELPFFEVRAEATNTERATELVQKYVDELQQVIDEA